LDRDGVIDPLLGQPEQHEKNGASLDNENRPGFDRAERKRTKHKQSESGVQQNVTDLNRPILALLFRHCLRLSITEELNISN
jgi:hypothetical protein